MIINNIMSKNKDSEKRKCHDHEANPSKNMRAVIINVDDLGLSGAVNEAVIHLAELRRICASSYMVGGVITDGDIRKLSELDVDIGLHLDLTGVFRSSLQGSLKSLILASYLRQLNIEQVTNIIKQQLDAFEDKFGHAPVFIDGHQHIHQLPVIRYCLANELNRRYGGNNAQTNISARITTPLINDFKSWVIYVLGGYAWRKLCEHHHMSTNDYFGGVYDFNANSLKLALLWEKWLIKAPRTTGLSSMFAKIPTSIHTNLSTTLIMCHPAVPDNSWQDEIKVARETEYTWLMSHEFSELIQRKDVKLVNWSNNIAIN
ncbi:ChbG/HpnK family deacetylase [Kordiimonas sp.]|uniref:ChbG/HpnK family deacetylase n=1 Tax=Kordiimonas sp. TaxID=1970157 RepID=UPI003A8DCAB7